MPDPTETLRAIDRELSAPLPMPELADPNLADPDLCWACGINIRLSGRCSLCEEGREIDAMRSYSRRCP